MCCFWQLPNGGKPILASNILAWKVRATELMWPLPAFAPTSALVGPVRHSWRVAGLSRCGAHHGGQGGARRRAIAVSSVDEMRKASFVGLNGSQRGDGELPSLPRRGLDFELRHGLSARSSIGQDGQSCVRRAGA